MLTKPKTDQQKTLKAARPLLLRTAAFLAVFVIFSGIIGPRIISNGLVGKDGFEIYGGSGKALLFGVLSLLLLIQRRGITIKLERWQVSQLLWIVLAVLSAGLSWLSVTKLIDGASGVNWIILAHTSIVACVLFALGGIISPSDIRHLVKSYKRELIISLILAIVFYGFLFLIYGLWKFLAYTVVQAVSGLLRLSGLTVITIPPRELLLNKFGINIAEYCSGIESIALFTALYALIGILDWHRFNIRRYFWIFPVALLILFGVNILRVYGLILAGYYINPQIAFSLFHTYAGMVFFILYSAAFWAICYKLMLRKQHKATVV